MRCPDCNKFVPYDEPQVEVQDSEIDQEGMIVRGNVRIVLPCGECGQELKDADLEFEIQFDHECPEGTKWNEDSGDEKFEIDGEVEATPSDRMETKNRKGREIKKARYMKHFYGADLTVNITCNACKDSFSAEGNVEEQASSFNELV